MTAILLNEHALERPMSLSSLIVQREIATIRQVEEALARQVLYGGDLVTNLLEVAKLDEGTLTLLLAESFGIQAATLGPLPAPQDQARALVSAEMAIERAIVPLSIEGASLIVAVAEPLAPEAEEELVVALGYKIVQRISPMIRVREALARVYGAPLERRTQRLLLRLGAEEIPGLVPSVPAPVLREMHPSDAPKERPRINTLPFQPMIGDAAPMSVHAPRLSTSIGFPAPPTALISPAMYAPRPVTVPPASPAPPHVQPPRVQNEARHESAPPPSITDVTSRSAPPPAATPTRAPDSSVTEPAPRPTVQFASHDTLEEPPRASLIQRELAPPPRPPRRRRGPITPDAARKHLDDAQDRDAILDLFFDYSRQYFDYSALFVVHADIAEGRDAYGDGASRERVTGIGVPLDHDSVLARAREQRGPVQRVPSKEGLDPVLLTDLQRKTAGEVLVVPVVVRTRAVALFYGDSGDSGVEAASVREVVPFALQVAKAFEKIIVRKKLHGFLASGGAATANAPPPLSKIDPEQVIPKAAPSQKSPLSESVAPPEDILPSAHRLSDPPPPPSTAAAVRRVSGPPIPREDPPESWPPGSEHPTPTEPHDVREEFELTFEDGPSYPTPPPSESFAVAARLPPSPRVGGSPVDLPSIIVDVDQEFGSMVDRVIAQGGDEQAEAELLRQGQAAMPAIMSRFPGPTTADRTRVEEGSVRIAECGPVLRLIAGQRKAALPFVLPMVGGGDVERRYWATFLLTELPYAEAIEALVPRLFDPEMAIRRVARLAARAVGEAAPDALIARLNDYLQDPNAPEVRRVEMVDALGELRDRLAVPALLETVDDKNDNVGAAARRALALITRQDFGRDARKWSQWWYANAARHRIEWLIDALLHESPALRRAAGEELKTVTKEYFGYYDDLPKRERERAQQRYRDWWTTEGRLRFRRG